MINFLHLQFIRAFITFIILIHSCLFLSAQAKYHVSKTGSDNNTGSIGHPFLTINKAAQIAKPGDIITVHEGVYREWINPLQGGESEELRIIFQAAQGEDVHIMGSEPVKGWVRQNDNYWKLDLKDAFFGDFNPFKSLTRHPEPVGVDESGDGWGWLKYGRWTHLGDVYIQGKGLTEKKTLEEVRQHELSWFVHSDDKVTTIWANFGTDNPNSKDVEINVRPYAFFPKKAGLNYMTVKGFTIMNIANHWAPPTVFQPGAVGSNGGHHWIVEDNIILYAKAAAISLGIPSNNYDSKERGHHMIRNNIILRCGQGGTTGQEWNSNSKIYRNHIEEINYRKEFGGWETAAIKHHGADNLAIKDNLIRKVYTIDPKKGAAHGIWNDYRNSNWKVTGNLVMDTEGHTILVEANWDGPNLYVNNMLANGTVGTYSTRGDAWVHNIFINIKHQWENQGWGDRPQIGNARWMNNIFLGGGLDQKIIEDHSIYDFNVLLDQASDIPEDKNAVRMHNPTKYSFEEDNDGIYLIISLDREVFEIKYPIIDSEVLNLPFSFDISIDEDKNGFSRSNKNLAGPFVGLEPGENKVMLYKFSPLYKKALKLLGKN